MEITDREINNNDVLKTKDVHYIWQPFSFTIVFVGTIKK